MLILSGSHGKAKAVSRICNGNTLLAILDPATTQGFQLDVSSRAVIVEFPLSENDKDFVCGDTAEKIEVRVESWVSKKIDQDTFVVIYTNKRDYQLKEVKKSIARLEDRHSKVLFILCAYRVDDHLFVE